jgi:hypothetical protein
MSFREKVTESRDCARGRAAHLACAKTACSAAEDPGLTQEAATPTTAAHASHPSAATAAAFLSGNIARYTSRCG